jgi:hypothetical protein
MSKRAGVTKKVSLSVHADDLKMLKQRAKRLYDGNVSAVFNDLIALVKRQEAWEKALAWYGKSVAVTDEERGTIDRELLGSAHAKSARKRRSAA